VTLTRPLWGNSLFVVKYMVDRQLNSSMQLISGTLRPTQLPWLPPPNIRREAACDKLLQTVKKSP